MREERRDGEHIDLESRSDLSPIIGAADNFGLGREN